MNASTLSTEPQHTFHRAELNPAQVLPPNTEKARWLGVLGGGQLGRMFVHEAQKMGYKVAVLAPEKDCPAAAVADQFFACDYEDSQALANFGKLCAAITTEFENVPAQSLAQLADMAAVAPHAQSVQIAQNRAHEKALLAECAKISGVAPAAHRLIHSDTDLSTVPEDLIPGILKTIRMGYDGKGQVKIDSRAGLKGALSQLANQDCILEKMQPIAHEISVLAARGANGDIVLYPVAENIHRQGILHTSQIPSPNVAPAICAQAQQATEVILQHLHYVGVLCAEFFVLLDGSLVVNEIAPRPHNSGHYTTDACVTNQFAQQVRAMTNLPLGSVRQHSPAIMLNLLGDIWFTRATQATPEVGGTTQEPAWQKILALPGTSLHLYGKQEPRPGRKMGHINFTGENLDQATARMLEACAILGIE